MRTENLRSLCRTVSETNRFITQALFFNEQFSVANAAIIAKNPDSLTSVVFKKNKYHKKFNHRLRDLESAIGAHQDFLWVTAYVFLYSVLEVYIEDMLKLVSKIKDKPCGKCKKSPLESLFFCLGSSASLHVDQHELITLEYIRLRRNLLVHAEGRMSKTLEKLISSEGSKLNSYWPSQDLILQSLDFSSCNIAQFDDREIVDCIRVVRRLAEKFDVKLLSLVGKQKVVDYLLCDFRLKFSSDIKQKSRSRLENKFATVAKMRFNLDRTDIDFPALTF